MPGYLYVIECVDKSYYVGSTTNVDARFATHEEGLGGDYTSRRLPLKLVFAEHFETLHEAFMAERQVKG
jgi:putative endonuclease